MLLPAGINAITANYTDDLGDIDASSTTIGPSSIIQTVAGGGSRGYAGDNGPATAAELNQPNDIAFDSAGDLFIADSTNHVIREVNAVTHVITTVAGDGGTDSSGDNGPATAAAVATPTAIAVDSAGDLFIAEGFFNVIREVNAVSQVITTIAGTGAYGYGGDNGPATAAVLDGPFDIALDSAGDLFIADSANNRIREINAVNQVITTVAGTGSPGYSGNNGPATAATLHAPESIALDSGGDLFIADTSNHVIREVNAVNQMITTVAGNGSEDNTGFAGNGGKATAAALGYPTGLAVDSAGDLFIADTFNNVIREVNAGSQVITTIAGTGSQNYAGNNGPATAAGLDEPSGLALDSAGDLFIADQSNNAIREVTPGSGVNVLQATPTLSVTDASGTYNGSAFTATDAVAGVVSGVDNTPAASLEGVTPSLTYYSGASATARRSAALRAPWARTRCWPSSPAVPITPAAPRPPRSPSPRPPRRSA